MLIPTNQPFPPCCWTLHLPHAFLYYPVTEEFMAKLTQFASDRENTTSGSLSCVFIIDWSKEHLPAVASIEQLRKLVPIVEVMKGIEEMELPKDLS